jgi:hypothetical protein
VRGLDEVRRRDFTRTDLLSRPRASARSDERGAPIGPSRGDLTLPSAVEWLTRRKVSRRLRSNEGEVQPGVARRGALQRHHPHVRSAAKYRTKRTRRHPASRTTPPLPLLRGARRGSVATNRNLGTSP